jgi:hypothetical protein
MYHVYSVKSLKYSPSSILLPRKMGMNVLTENDSFFFTTGHAKYVAPIYNSYLVIYSDRRSECILPCQVPDMLSDRNDNWSVMRNLNVNCCIHSYESLFRFSRGVTC